jgi:hypothetical protein
VAAAVILVAVESLSTITIRNHPSATSRGVQQEMVALGRLRVKSTRDLRNVQGQRRSPGTPLSILSFNLPVGCAYLGKSSIELDCSGEVGGYKPSPPK